ncbi:tetratricopeptide repeat protein [Anaerocolumna sp.]|uniref:tetratricopeptide repeat protein n=1 Tax=Anaerocolumna sp. TaxID=2041569 RepID=UPI0028A94F77|nr:tetratricopeptide repeat protein [Anaerocolumna sp.]
MIRYENRIKMQEIRRLVEEHQYIKAAHVVDTLELSKIKSLPDLSVIADVLIQNDRFDDALQVLSKVYAKSKTRRILYQLVDLSIRSKDVEEAEKYLLQYMKVAPQDSYRFIFRYSIDKLKNEPYEVLIESLEELKEYDYVEKWAYELAKLYHKAGKKDKCVRECSDIVLWFGDGIYVEKAKLLKGYYVGEIDPIRMLKATEKKEAEKRLGLDKTKDYSSMKNEIDKFIAEEENAGQIKKKAFEGKDTEEAEKLDEFKADDKRTVSYITEEKYELAGEKPGIIREKDGIAEEEFGIVREEPETVKEESRIVKEESEIVREDEIAKDELETIREEEPKIIREKESKIIREESEITKREQEISDGLPELEETYAMKGALETEKGVNSHRAEEAGITPDTTAADISMVDQEEAVEDEKLEQIFKETNLDYHKLFGYFIHNRYYRNEIADFLENMITDNKKPINLTICGNKKSGKTALAREIAKALYGLGRISSSKIAKISASRINRMNLEDNFDKLVDCTLLIEEASALNNSGIKQLLHLLWRLEGHIFVILEDSPDGINKLLDSDENMKNKFEYGITIPCFTEEDLFHYANHYISVSDYKLSKEAEVLLKNIIQEIMNSDTPEDGLEIIMKIVIEAEVQADERNKEELLRIIGSQRLSETDFMYIKLEDFESIYGEEIK